MDQFTLDLLSTRDVVRSATQHRLAEFSHLDNISIEELVESDQAWGHWMSIILIGGADLRITLKVFFFLQEAGHYAAGAWGTKEPTEKQITEFVKEFCNLVAGSVKAFLSAGGVITELSLPLIARGFDDNFFPQVSGTASITDNWRLGSGPAVLSCTSHIELFSSVISAAGSMSNGDNSAQVESYENWTSREKA